ncbi:hypothetical protein [Cyanothece sp. BG0011]
MDNPKKAADKLLQFYQGGQLKTLIDYLQRGLSDLTESSEETSSKIVQEILSNKSNENGKLLQPNNSAQLGEETTKELEVESTNSDLKTDNQDSPEISESIVIDDSSTSKSPESNSSEQTTKDSEEISNRVSLSSENVEQMRLTSSELAKRLGLQPQSVSNAISKKGKKFPEWSQKRDPDGIAWQKSEKKEGRNWLFSPLKDEVKEMN